MVKRTKTRWINVFLRCESPVWKQRFPEKSVREKRCRVQYLCKFLGCSQIYDHWSRGVELVTENRHFPNLIYARELVNREQTVFSDPFIYTRELVYMAPTRGLLTKSPNLSKAVSEADNSNFKLRI